MADLLEPAARGRRTLVQTLDAWADHRPDKIHASALLDQDVSKGFRDITSGQLRAAVDSFAHWLVDSYGASSSHQTLAYVGLSDIRYAVFLFGCIKAGYKALFVSPRNPPEQNASLLSQVQATRFFHSSELASVVDGVKSILPSIETAVVLPFDHWLNTSRPFPFTKTFDETRLDPILVLHSSGSTGAPKPVTITNGFFAAIDRRFAAPPGRDINAGGAAFDFPGGGFAISPFPPFHLAGVQSMSIIPVMALEASIVLGLPDRPASPALLLDMIKAKKPRALYSPPSLIEGICQLPTGMDALYGCEKIVYAGGPLSNATGDILSKKVQLGTVFGSTETGGAHLLVPAAEDWAYLEFHPDYGARLEPTFEGASELVFSQDDPYSDYRGITFTHPESRVYRTRDLFLPHPTKPNLWRFYGRNDDIIVFSTGAKYNPVPAEDTILGSDQISGIIIIGDRRTQASALIEPKANTADPKSLIDAVWPFVEKANRHSQRQGHLAKHMIAIVEPGGLIRSPKATIVRSHTRDKYKDVIDRLYYAEDDDKSGPVFNAPRSLQDALLGFVRECVQSLKGLGHVQDDDDFYVNGLDSIQTAQLARVLRSGLRPQYGDVAWLTNHLIFAYPSIQRLAAAIQSQTSNTKTIQDLANDDSALGEMAELIEKYTHRLPELQNTPLEPSAIGTTIIVTGSTGSLGLRTLEALVKDPAVASVVSLDRSGNAKDRVAKSIPQLDLSKVVFHQASFGLPDFGLPLPVIQHLAEQTIAIIHCAWQVDFNQTLASFEPVHIRGVANLLAFSATAPRHPRVMFVSSISTVTRWGNANGAEPVPERVLSEPTVAGVMGYARSKFVAENILDAASRKYAGRVPVSVLRVGQIAGPVGESSAAGPSWNRDEWFPALLATSKALKAVPDYLGTLDWLPVNVVASAIHDFLNHDKATEGVEPCVYNVVNPHRTAWMELLPVIQTGLGGIPTIPLAEWTAKLAALPIDDISTLETHPAVKILPFFQAIDESRRKGTQNVYATDKTTAASATLKNVQPVNAVWMKDWIAQSIL